MDQNARSKLFPPNFPVELTAAAFIAGTETAWRPPEAITAVEWFGAHGFAVLGTELWLLQNGAIQSLPVGTSGLGEAHGNAVDGKHGDEAWASYVGRTAADTLRYLKSFNPAEIIEKGDLYFQVEWISENDYEKLIRS